MKDKKEIKRILKIYHLISITIFFVPLIINNYSLAFEKRNIEEINLNNNFNKIPNIPFKRELDFYEDSMKVCSKSSENLAKYFETGDTQYVKLYEYTSENDPPEYIIALTNALSSEGNSEENFNTYLKHHLPILFFLVVSMACFPLWIIWCTCSCYNCYCFNCCKKPDCRWPFFIVVSVMNFLVIITCIVGLSKTNDIFKGVINTECSILRFISEILEGESKSTLPKWGGVRSIIKMFDSTILQIEEMSSDEKKSEIESKKNAYNTAKTNFINSLKAASTQIYSETNYLYDTNYILDIAKEFGKYENNKFTEGSFAEKWIKEANFSDNIDKSYNVLGELIVSNVAKGMRKAEELIEYINDGIEELKDMIGEKILEFSEKIDNIGKLIFKLIFSVLFCFCILIESLLIFLFLFSSRKCVGNFCCMNFLVKTLIHILWNVFALLMIGVFLFGTCLSFIGALGEDIFEMFSFIISKKNLNDKSPMILGEGAVYFDICINEDGVIYDELGIESDLGKIDILKTLTYEIDSIIEQIIINEANTNKDFVYEELISKIDNKESENNFDLVKIDSTETNDKLNLKETMSNLNNKLRTCSINERWSFSCNTEFTELSTGTCDSTSSDTSKCMDPFTCNNELGNVRYPSTCNDANNLGEVINKIVSAIKYINGNNQNSIKIRASLVRAAYRQFLIDAKNALDNYTKKFTPLTAIYDNFVGNGSVLGFLNCAFLGKNVKVMLQYLDNSIGKQLKSLGISLLINGIGIALSISFTIILVVIINATVDIRKNNKNNQPINNQQNKIYAENNIIPNNSGYPCNY